MKLTFIGDIMLGRLVLKQYKDKPYEIVDSKLKEKLRDSDFVMANLESPTPNKDTPKENELLKFFGDADLLKEFSWIDCFSLSNNHINDGGIRGMNETIEALDNANISWNGLYKEEYTPVIIQKEGNKIAIFTCDDLMNHEFSQDCPWHTLRVGDNRIYNLISQYKKQGYYVILFAHVGMLFTRFPSPLLQDWLHKVIDETNLDLVVTVHSHAEGGMETYKNTRIYHSLGDFVMDGSSFRRRQNYSVIVDIENNEIKDVEIIYGIIDTKHQAKLAEGKTARKMEKSFEFVNRMMEEHKDDYARFYKTQYKKEMFHHSLSTVSFLFKTKGARGALQMLLKRAEDVKGICKRLTTDRSNMRHDTDAVNSSQSNDIL